MRTVLGEALRMRRWPALWVAVGVWLLLDVMFAYVFPYLSYRNGSAELAEVLPAGAPLAGLSGMPMFGGAILLTLGALAAGSGYAWGTWKTAFSQGPSRLAVTGGMITALAGVVLAVVLVTLVLNLGVAAILAGVEGAPIALPGAGDVLRGLGGGVLVLGMWVTAGVALGTLARSPALAVGLGVVWALAVENLLRGVASALDWLAPVTDVLPGTAAGSLVAAFGAAPVSEGGTPGVVSNVDGMVAGLLILAYLVVFVAGTALLMRRRDVS